MEQQESNLFKDFHLRREKNNWYTFDEVARIIRDLLYGLFEIHSNKIIHRDLKPANILRGSCDYKIADFGISKYLENMISKINQSIIGTQKYLSPQIYYSRNIGQAEYSSKTDIYSLGIIFYQIAFQGQLPWQQDGFENDQNKFMFQSKKKFSAQQVKLAAQPERLEQLRLLIEKMIKLKEEDRPGWLELLTHPLVVQQNQIVQMNQTSYTKLIYESILNQLKATQFIKLRDNYLDIQQQNQLKNDINHLLNKFYIIMILQISKSSVVETYYKQLKKIIYAIPEVGLELIYIAIHAYIGHVYYRLRSFCFNEIQSLTPFDQQFYKDNKLNYIQKDPVFLQIKELIDQQYIMVKVLLLNYTEKLLILLNNQIRYNDYLQLIQANEQGYYQLFQKLLKDFLEQYQLDQIQRSKLQNILQLEESYPLKNYLNQSIGTIQNI